MKLEHMRFSASSIFISPNNKQNSSVDHFTQVAQAFITGTT